MQHFSPATRRVIASHGLAALAVALPWPLLLVLVADSSDDPLLLGLVAAARMIPYVALSWVTARLADAMRRDLIVRATLVVRASLLLAAAVSVATDHVWLAVAACTLAVAVGTPAYPAQVAAMPGIAGSQRLRATDLLVTVEVAAFVVGAALGGVLLHPGTRGVLPWLPAVMTLVALLLVVRVSMPAPARTPGEDQRPSPSAALREAPAALRAIAVMAAINFVLALMAVALLPMAVHRWSSDAAGYGLATGVLGFAAFGAPLLRRLGRSPEHSITWSLVLLALGLVLVIPVPSVGWALAPLALAGAAAVSVEAAATAVLQEHVSDEVRATVLGINDTVIIAAALVGSLIAPVAVAIVGGALLLCGMAIALLVVAWWALPRRRAGHHARATVGATSLEAHEPARPVVTPAVVDRDARRAAVRRDRLLTVEQRHRPAVIVVGQQSDERSTEPPLKYVALGDSYSSAPLVPVTDVANGCFRSSANYPSLVAKKLAAQLDDHTCGGARTVDFHRSQFPDVPPQLAAVKPGVDLVTLGTGGNDQQVFAQLTRRCPGLRAQDPDGSPCRTYMGSRGNDVLLTALDETRKKVTGLVREVRERAPDAQVIVVGYPQIISADDACSKLPLAKGDYAYAEEINLALTQALRAAAEANDATYVDVWAASKGHDICSEDPWVNGSVSDQKRAAAYHPFAKEQAAVADLVVAAVQD